MAFKVQVNIDSNWQSKQTRGLEQGLAELVTDIDRRSKALTPVLSGNLVNSQRIARLGALAYSITSGSARVPYARRQYYTNRTKSRWLEKAAESVTRGDTSKYFRNKV